MRAPQFETVVTIKYQLNLHCEKASTEANGNFAAVVFYLSPQSFTAVSYTHLRAHET